MSEKDERTKSRYESPIVVPLGEMARGTGDCSPGASVQSEGDCAGGGAILPECAGGSRPD
jgi:hypothetical protein